MNEPLFNAQQFLQSLANDDELAHELLAAFLEDSSARTSSLEQALDEADAGKASKLAHSLKGMCGVVRTDALVNLSLLMESSAKHGDLAKTRDQFSKFSDLLKSAQAEMRQFLNDK